MIERMKICSDKVKSLQNQMLNNIHKIFLSLWGEKHEILGGQTIGGWIIGLDL